jgi:hypothetical protein
MYFVKPFLVTPAAAPTRTSTATYLDAAGVLKYAAINEVRPIIETSAATNLIASSAVFTVTSSFDDLFSDATLSPDGVSMADVMQLDASGDHTLASSQSTALVVGATYGASLFVKRLSGPSLSRCVVSVGFKKVLARILPFNGFPVGIVSSSSVSNAALAACANGWVRIGFQFVATSTSAVRIVVSADNGFGDAAESTSFSDSSSQYAAWGGQLELGGVSSHIPTSGATATRAADVLPASTGISDLIGTNVALTDYAAWLVGTAYALGNCVIVGTDIYEALLASTGVNPVGDTTAKWIKVGKVNAWKMFDTYMGTATRNAESIGVTIRPGAAADSLALFGVVAASVSVTVYDAVEGQVYEKTISMVSHAAASSWHSYFFSPQIAKSILVLKGLPRSRNCTISIQLSQPGGFAECGMCLVGSAVELGDAQWGLGFGIQDYSAKTAGTYGERDIVERAYADRANYQLMVATGDNQRIKEALAAVRAKACVYVGHPGFPESIVYGYYKSFDQVLRYLTYSDCNLEIEGLT